MENIFVIPHAIAVATQGDRVDLFVLRQVAFVFCVHNLDDPLLFVQVCVFRFHFFTKVLHQLL